MKAASIWRFGDFQLDSAARRLSRGGSTCAISPKAFDILVALVKAAGQLVSRSDLFESVWSQAEVEDANLTNNITALRKILGNNAIQTVSKFGYRFCLPVVSTDPISPGAEQAFREGQTHMLRRTAASVQQARDLFWLVIADDPAYAPPWAWLARACRFLEKFGVERDYHRQLSNLALNRALTLEPYLGSAQQLHVNIQVDRGHAVDALRDLLHRIRENREDAASFAALVQVFRFCGLLDASKAAHRRAKELQPSIETSLPHTYFAGCEFQAVVEVYSADSNGSRIFLDLSAWAALGFLETTEKEIVRRLNTQTVAPIFNALLTSLLLAIRGQTRQTEELCSSIDLYEDPESLLYFARHLAFCGAVDMAAAFLCRALDSGFAASILLENDPWLACLRSHSDFSSFVQRASKVRRAAHDCLESARVDQILNSPPSALANSIEYSLPPLVTQSSKG